ncbi:MAG: SDR family NAD(P)-dependent oxidoreductase [Rhodoglobus sp.]|nr:SDR family NAD(P)-dependent oxidoreductase [Rhodoglobus sp.]
MTDRLVVIAGASSASGRAVAARLTDAGARVIAVGSNLGRLAAVDALARYECDLADPAAVDNLAATIRAEHGGVDGLVHLVGGWRAGRGDEDWAWLRERVVETFRNTSRSFFDDLVASAAGRLVIVSSTSVNKPTWGNANYSAAKSAAEAWARSAASGFVNGGTAASVIFVVRSLGDEEGATPHDVLAARVATLWDSSAADLNGARVSLVP